MYLNAIEEGEEKREEEVKNGLCLMTAGELAKYLNLKVSKVRAMVFRNELPVIRIGRLVRFERQSIHQWLDSLKAPVSSLSSAVHDRNRLPIFEIDTRFRKGSFERKLP